MNTLKNNARAFLQQKFPTSGIWEKDFDAPAISQQVHGFIVLNFDQGVLYPVLAIPQLGANGANELDLLMYLRPHLVGDMRSSVVMEMSAGGKQKRSTQKLVDGPVLLLYTDRLAMPIEPLINKFDEVGMEIDVVSEDELHKSAFISFGGPDQAFADEINTFLRNKGVRTWFFPVDKLPGQKLHRMMYEGVNNHDRVLLICSRSSLSRPGVLNEIERVLERESNEGGSDILIPLSIDEFLFSEEFRPERPDIAAQIRSRVVATIPGKQADPTGFEREMLRVLAALKGPGQ